MIKFICSLIPLLSVLYSCNSEKPDNKVEKYNFINKLSSEDLEILRGVNISIRNKGDAVYSFGILLNNIYYQLPVYDTFKKKENIMNSEWYNVLNYAEANNIDSAEAYNFAKKVSDTIVAIFYKIGVYGIRQDPSLGDFIIFELSNPNIDQPKERIIYLYPVGKIKSQYWKDYFTEEKKIKDNWYKNW